MATVETVVELGNPTLLDKIDKLFEANIGDYVNLPQLLVVGDQSSGKSSILEGLTGLPFPRDKVLCTRFATQITFKRVPTQRLAVSIKPAADASAERQRKLRSWKKDDLNELSREKFTEMMAEVQDVMGIGNPEAAEAEGRTTFSDDVLKIEICGPKEQHLSVIDVPGIFRMKTQGVTTDEDKDMVRRMVKSYMQNPRSVILAIVPANVDMATQEIVEMAEGYDKEGTRTLGVLTKPDLVDEGAEDAVLDILRGDAHKLKLGWCAVMNPGQKALDSGAPNPRDVEKTFFRTKLPWNQVHRDQAGIEALRQRLVGILSDMIEREFPEVKKEIGARLKATKRKLEALGPSRESREQRYKLLLDLAMEFQKMASNALGAKYGTADILDSTPDLRLATLVVDRNEHFDKDVSQHGHKINFDESSDAVSEAEELDADDAASQTTAESHGKAKNRFADDTSSESDADHEQHFRVVRPMFEIEDILPEATSIPITSQPKIKEWLRNIYKTSRGFELGTFDAALLPLIWKRYAINWNALANGYISDIVCIVHRFCFTLLGALCADAKVEKGLKQVLLDKLTSKYKLGVEHTKFILDVEVQGTPATTNHYFADNLEKCRERRVKEASQSRAFDDCKHGTVVRLSDISLKTNKSNLEHTIDDLHDILRSYYKVARKRFVDEMCMQAADHFLINGPDTPIKLFSPAFVNELSDEELQRIAGEDPSTVRKREELQRDIDILEQGRSILL